MTALTTLTPYFSTMEEACIQWSWRTLDSLDLTVSGEQAAPTAALLYRKVHLRDIGNVYEATASSSEELISNLRELFDGKFAEEGWEEGSLGYATSPEGITVHLESGYKTNGAGRLYLPQLHLYGMPGWHLVNGPLGPPRGRRCRIYLPGIMDKTSWRELATLLQGCNHAWHLKTRSDGSDPRPDRTVLYVPSGVGKEMLESIVTGSSQMRV